MALVPLDATHAAQIQAGINGRRVGHNFEFDLAQHVNALPCPHTAAALGRPVFRGDPASVLVRFALSYIGWSHCDRVEAIALGALATAEEGKKWLDNGVAVRACKSEILLTCFKAGLDAITIGVSPPAITYS